MTFAYTPLVTVYIPNYNYGAYISTAVESVLCQTFKAFEVIIIDDGSTDDSREIIARYQTHPQIRIIFQENRGLNQTNNIALKAARGKYIMRLDADDYLDPNALLVMTTVMESEEDLGLVFPDYYYVDATGQITGQERRHDFRDDVTLLDQPAHGACTLIRKQALLEVGEYSEVYRCQDGYDLWLRFIEQNKVRNINLPLFYYRRHGENLTTNSQLILETRARIKKDHAEATGKPQIPVLALIAERGRLVDPGSLAMEELGGKRVIDWTIETTLRAQSVKNVILSTPDDELLRHVRKRYGSTISYHKRSIPLARENVSLDLTMREALECCKADFTPGAFMLLQSEYPLRKSIYLEKAVNTMRIFNVDSVIGVVPDNDIFFRHNGHGLELVGDLCQLDSLRLERDYLYRMAGGLQLVSAEFYKRTGKRLGGRIGHVVIDRNAGIKLTDALSLTQIKLLVESSKL